MVTDKNKQFLHWKESSIAKRVISSALVVAMIISVLSGLGAIQTAKAASADETRVLAQQEKINGILKAKTDYTNWIKRYKKYENGTYTDTSGLCTWCAIRDLLNRRLAQDATGTEKDLFSFEEVARTIVLRESAAANYNYTREDFAKGYREVERDSEFLNSVYIEGYNPEGKFAEILAGDYSYQFPTRSGSYEIEKKDMTGNLARRKTTLRNLIDDHPEGVFVYYQNGKTGDDARAHGFLLIGYRGEGEATQFYAHDTGDRTTFDAGKLFDLANVHVAKHENSITNATERANAVISKLTYCCYISKNKSNDPIDPNKLKIDDFIVELEKTSPIPLGASCNINGNINGTGITKVSAKILRENGTTYTTAADINCTAGAYTEIPVCSSSINGIKFSVIPAGNYKLIVSVHGKTTVTEKEYPFTIGTSSNNNTSNASVSQFNIMIDGKTNDGSSNNIALKKGYGCRISGTIQGTGVKYAIAKVLKNDQTLQTSGKANASNGKITVEDSAINSDIHFASLAVGDYKLEVTVYDANGKTLATKRVSFSISLTGTPSVTKKKTENGITIDLTDFSTTLPKGKIYHVPGTITSTAGIKSIRARVYDTRSGQYGYPSQIEANDTNPKTNPYDLNNSQIDKNLSFGRLAAGNNYIFEITVTNNKNQTCKLSIAIVVR